MSPQRTAEKRSCWDITTANSPSIATLNGRRRRSYISSACAAAPSVLLQAMFAFACFFYIYSMMNLINYFYRNFDVLCYVCLLNWTIWWPKNSLEKTSVLFICFFGQNTTDAACMSMFLVYVHARTTYHSASFCPPKTWNCEVVEDKKWELYGRKTEQWEEKCEDEAVEDKERKICLPYLSRMAA